LERLEDLGLFHSRKLSHSGERDMTTRAAGSDATVGEAMNSVELGDEI
jgi:hypothetical protein